MQVTIKTVSKKLTTSILAQVQEATAADISYALKNETVLGYINPIGNVLTRVFLIIAENGDYRVVTNIDWRISESEKETLFGMSRLRRTTSKLAETPVKKVFSTEAAKILYLENFKKVKQKAMENHIYV